MKVYVTKVFQNGGSKAIRIPAEIRPDAEELFIWADVEGRLVISPENPKLNPSNFLDWASKQEPVLAEDEKYFQRNQPQDEFSNPFADQGGATQQ
jgi:virulence-associated protein VagC